ncbi:MAG: TRAP transporter substrate-binding protein [Desulfatitalea sp.]|nr:TRAP transporter substrate-binding protein [Desulfatitalea sp.]
MKRKLILCLVVAMLFGFSVMPVHAKTTWIANSVWPPNNHQTIALEQFAAKIKAVTDGELEIIVNSGGALGYKGPELLKAVRDNLVPVSDMLISGVAGDEAIFQVVTVPFLSRNFEELKLLIDIAKPHFDQAAAKWNQKILYISPWPGAGLWTTKKVTSVGEMRGLKTRTYDKNGALVVEATGGTPYALPFSEVYSSLATGLIDSVITSTPTAVDAKFWEVLKFYQPLNITIATNMVNVNLRAFNRLDAKTQQAVLDAAKALEEELWANIAVLDKEKESISNQNGIETVPVSDALMDALTEVTIGIRNDYLASAPAEAKAIVADYLKQVGR